MYDKRDLEPSIIINDHMPVHLPPTFNGLQPMEKTLGGLEWQRHVVIPNLSEGGGGEGDSTTHIQRQHKGHAIEGAEHLTAHPVVLYVGYTHCAICRAWMEADVKYPL